jgi:predicted transcriptional regulator
VEEVGVVILEQDYQEDQVVVVVEQVLIQVEQVEQEILLQ